MTTLLKTLFGKIGISVGALAGIRCALLTAVATALHAPTARSQAFQFETRGPNQKGWDGRVEARLREEGLQLPAGKPSNADPEGNWGFSNVGWELSVRTVLPKFTAGDPVYLWAILRNVSGTNSELTISIPDLKWDPTVTTADGRVLEPSYAWVFKPEFDRDMKARAIRASKQIISGTGQYPVRAGHQCLLLLRLSEDYDLTAAGTYSVRLSRRFNEFGRTEFQQVTSGTATFRVVEKAGAANPNTNVLTNNAAQSFGQVSMASQAETGKTSHATVSPGSDGGPVAAAPGGTSGALGSQSRLIIAVVGFAVFGLLLAALLRRRRS